MNDFLKKIDNWAQSLERHTAQQLLGPRLWGPVQEIKAASLKHPQEREGQIETINHKQAIKIKSVFLNSFLIKNKCLINLEHIDLRTHVKSRRVTADMTRNTALCVFPFQEPGRDRHHRRSLVTAPEQRAQYCQKQHWKNLEYSSHLITETQGLRSMCRLKACLLDFRHENESKFKI